MIVGEAIFGLRHFAKAFTITVPQSNVPSFSAILHRNSIHIREALEQMYETSWYQISHLS